MYFEITMSKCYIPNTRHSYSHKLNVYHKYYDYYYVLALMFAADMRQEDILYMDEDVESRRQYQAP